MQVFVISINEIRVVYHVRVQDTQGDIAGSWSVSVGRDGILRDLFVLFRLPLVS